MQLLAQTRRVAAAIGLAVLLLPSGAAAQSLTDALIAAYRNSNLLEQNRAVLRAADEDVAQAVADLRPVVNFIARTQAEVFPGADIGSRSTSLSASLALSADVTVHDFGRGRLAVEAAQANVLAVRAGLMELEQRVLLNTVSAFMEVRSAADQVALRESNVRLIEQELNAARERFDVGEVTRTDVSIAEARLAGARSELAAAQGDLAVAREEYRLATGTAPGQLRAPPALPATATSLDAAQQVARHNHPAIQAVQQEVAAAELNAERAARARQGTVSAGASAGVSASRSNLRGLGSGSSLDGSIGAELSYRRPLYQGGALPSQVRQARARRDAVRAELHQTVAEVLQGVARAWSNAEVAAARIEASRLQIDAAETSFEGIREEATLGARTTLDVLNAEQELLDARGALVDAQAAQQVAAYAVLEAMGLLTVDHLNLGIPTYDPEAYFNAVRNAPARSPQGEALDRVLQSLGRD